MDEASRRRFLTGTALAGLGLAAAFGRARPVAALSLEAPDAETASLYANRCSIDTTHRQMVAEALAKLEGERSPAEVEAVLSTMTCPFCGCRLG